MEQPTTNLWASHPVVCPFCESLIFGSALEETSGFDVKVSRLRDWLQLALECLGCAIRLVEQEVLP
jgi:hypothetical protein